jgi:uncharacterized protein (TIGR01244 family)
VNLGELNCLEIHRYSVQKLEKDNMNDCKKIMRFRQVSDTIATSGQPLPEEFRAIQAAGFQVVINLALPTSEGALTEEQKIVESLGMEYVHIPVLWEKPTIEQIEQFFEAMNANANVPVFVHCAKNMRVSAFIYLYQRVHQRISDEVAKAGLHQIWIPNETWSHFIQTVLNEKSLL